MVVGPSLNRFYNIFRQAPAAMAVFRAADLQAEFVNEKYREIFGEKPEAFSDHYSLHDLAGGQLFEPYVTQVVRSGQSLILDNQALPIKGEYKPEAGYFQLTFQPLLDAANVVEGVLMMATELKNALPVDSLAADFEATPAQESHAWTDTIAQAGPDNLLVFRVVRNADGHPQEFEPLDQEYESNGKSNGREAVTIKSRQPLLDSDSLISLYKKVAETGEDYVGDIDLPARGGWHKVTIARRDPDTLVTTLTEMTQPQRAEATDLSQSFRLQDVLEGSLSAMLACEPVRTVQGNIEDFKISRANQEALAITGYPAEHLAQSTLLSIFPDIQKVEVPSVGSTAFKGLCEVANTGMLLQDEVFVQLSPHEKSRWYKIRAIRLNECILLSFDDITESRQATQTVGQQADFIQCVFDLIPSGIAHLQPVFDSRGRVTDFVVKLANKATLRQIGIDPGKSTGKLLSTLLPDYRKTAFFGAFQQVVYFTPFLQGEFVYTYKGKNKAWINLAVSKYEDGLMVSFDNVTEAKQNEQEIKDTEDRLQAIIDTVQIAVGLLSPVYNENDEVVDFWFRTANQAYASALGQQRADIINTRLSQWIPGYLSNGLFEAYREVYMTGEGRQFDFHYHSDGFDDWIDVKATRLNEFLLITGTNYTRLKQVQLQAEALVEDLRKSNDNLEKFAYVASHDLQEPLRKIQAFGEILQKKHGDRLDESGVDIIRRMQKSADRMQTLITDLLTYSRVSTNKVSKQSVDLNRLLNDLLVDLETVVQEKNALVEVEELPVIRGELTQLRQLFQNLLSNSLKFSCPERQLRIQITCKTVTGRTTDWFVPPTEADKVFAQIQIRDNGIGFDPRYTERIFQVFQRLHGRSEYPGTGIGLAIVQKVVENHKGYLTAEGRPNEGATFRLLLPL